MKHAKKYLLKYLLGVGIAFLILFTLFSYSIKRGAFRNVDFAFTVKVQDAIDKSPQLRLSRFAGEVMEGSTFLASPEISIAIIIFITLIIFIKTKKNRWVALSIPILFVFLVLAELYGKTVVHHPAPPFFMIKNPATVFPKYYINDQYSYPSGHAARAVFFSVILFFILNTRYLIRDTSDKARKKKALIIGVVLFVYLSLVSVSRIYLGHHWLSDVIGGWLLGIGCACIVVSVLRRNVHRISVKQHLNLRIL